MAGKNPAWMHYPNDWEKDLGHQPHEIGGAWMLILCRLHWHGGDLTQTWTEWSKILRVSVSKTKRIISYLDEKCIANVTKVAGQRGGVRIVNRRKVREAKEREQNRIRQKEWYDKSKEPNTNLTDDLTPIQQEPNTPSSSSSSITSSITKNKNPLTPSQGDRVPYQKIVDIYHEELPGLASVRVVGDTMKRAIKARCRGNKERLDPEWWRSLFRDQVASSDFLMGKKKDWAATLSFIVKASKFEALLNGTYTNKTKVKPPPKEERKSVREMIEDQEREEAGNERSDVA